MTQASQSSAFSVDEYQRLTHAGRACMLLADTPRDVAKYRQDFLNAVKAECERFERFMMDIDPASKVTWASLASGFWLYIFGHANENADAIHHAIIGNSALLKPSGIQPRNVEVFEEVIRIFVPYHDPILASRKR